jgi:hypothetical protein
VRPEPIFDAIAARVDHHSAVADRPEERPRQRDPASPIHAANSHARALLRLTHRLTSAVRSGTRKPESGECGDSARWVRDHHRMAPL